MDRVRRSYSCCSLPPLCGAAAAAVPRSGALLSWPGCCTQQPEGQVQVWRARQLLPSWRARSAGRHPPQLRSVTAASAAVQAKSSRHGARAVPSSTLRECGRGPSAVWLAGRWRAQQCDSCMHSTHCTLTTRFVAASNHPNVPHAPLAKPSHQPPFFPQKHGSYRPPAAGVASAATTPPRCWPRSTGLWLWEQCASR
jgi:hypothetical protein